MLHELHWSHAVAGRLTAAQLDGAAAQAARMAARLRTESAAGLLPFLTQPYRRRLEEEMPPLLPALRRRKHMLLLGIGGSALGARALQRAFAPAQDEPEHHGPCLWIADNVCPATFGRWLSRLSPSETSVVCVSKSGGTIETVSQYLLARDWLRAALGDAWREHVVLVTDRQSGFLREEAGQFALPSLEVPDHLGGRYSVLSAVGLLPAAFLGLDWQGLLDGAAGVAAPLLQAAADSTGAALAAHPAFALAGWAHALEQAGYDQLIFFCYMPQWATFGPWFAQLWAESLGKDGTGTQPLPATGVTDQHSINQMFLDGPRNKACLFVSGPETPEDAPGLRFGQDLPERWAWLRGRPFGCLLDAEALGTRMALCASGVPLLHLKLNEQTCHAAGAMMLLLEAATLFTGWLNGINPLDQPAVELGKRLANARLGAPGLDEARQALQRFTMQDDGVQTF